MILFEIINFHQSDERLFYSILDHVNHFRRKRKWLDLFKQKDIFATLLTPSPERNLFDYLCLKTAIDREFDFMVDKILKHSVITHKIITKLMLKEKYPELINLCVKGDRPKYLKLTDKELNKEKRQFGGKEQEEVAEEGSTKQRRSAIEKTYLKDKDH